MSGADPTFDYPALLGGPPIWPEGPRAWPGPDPEVAAALAAAVADGSWGRYSGRHQEALCERLRTDLGVEHVELCSSGTAAVELALRGLKIGPGDEVILSAYDFPGNFNDILTVGATPVLVDAAEGDWQLDVAQLPRALSSATKAILVSHLHGGMVDMDGVRQFADAHKLAVIEDACQASGATFRGRPAGSSGDVGVFSFGGSKLLSAGRGGAIVTNRADIAQRIRLYAQRGNDAYPLSELQAAVLLPQWDRLAERNRRRAVSVQMLRDLLGATSGLEIYAAREPGTVPAYYKVGMKYDPARFDGLSRDRFLMAIRPEGFAIDPGFSALQLTHSARRFRAVGELPVARDIDARGLVLHHPVLLQDETALRAIFVAVEKVRRHAREFLSRI